MYMYTKCSIPVLLQIIRTKDGKEIAWRQSRHQIELAIHSRRILAKNKQCNKRKKDLLKIKKNEKVEKWPAHECRRSCQIPSSPAGRSCMWRCCCTRCSRLCILRQVIRNKLDTFSKIILSWLRTMGLRTDSTHNTLHTIHTYAAL